MPSPVRPICRKRRRTRRSTQSSSAITDALKSGGEVRLVGFGTFYGRSARRLRRAQSTHRRENHRSPRRNRRSSSRASACATNSTSDHCAAAACRRRSAQAVRAISSAGRASRLHREGRRFKSVIAHQKLTEPIEISGQRKGLWPGNSQSAGSPKRILAKRVPVEVRAFSPKQEHRRGRVSRRHA